MTDKVDSSSEIQMMEDMQKENRAFQTKSMVVGSELNMDNALAKKGDTVGR